jgi:hypothetical protein
MLSLIIYALLPYSCESLDCAPAEEFPSKPEADIPAANTTAAAPAATALTAAPRPAVDLTEDPRTAPGINDLDSFFSTLFSFSIPLSAACSFPLKLNIARNFNTVHEKMQTFIHEDVVKYALSLIIHAFQTIKKPILYLMSQKAKVFGLCFCVF